jgi:hypothetical protein
MSKCAVGSATPASLISTFAAAFLMLNLAAMTGVSTYIYLYRNVSDKRRKNSICSSHRWYTSISCRYVYHFLFYTSVQQI